MNVAIVAPSPVPFVLGGAENLWLALQQYLNEETFVQCELIKVPARESSFSEVLASYKAFSNLDLGFYDHVITGKYPAWMLSHDSHALYMLHPLRGLYDTYHLTNLPLDFHSTNPMLAELRTQMATLRKSPSAGGLSQFFSCAEELVAGLANQGETIAFPGPLAREIVHFLDGYAAGANRISRFAAISRTVAGRQDYFPRDASVKVLYPPPRLTGYKAGGDEYLFTASRLDGPKRIGLLIEAMRQVKSDIRLLIGGQGPDEERLRTLAGNDSRIVFLGFLTDDELLEYYSNTLAVLFVPYDEDYGFITIEGMRSGKPVLTVNDAGGPTEFVIHRETGLVVSPDPAEIAQGIEYLVNHRAEAKAMGRNGRRLVSSITWSDVAEGLLGARLRGALRARASTAGNRKKMVVAVTFPIYPPRGGGQARIYHLYKELASSYDITIVSLAGVGEQFSEMEIAPGLREIRVPKSSAHQEAEDSYSAAVQGVPVTDVVAGRLMSNTPKYLQSLSEACERCDIVVLSHPFLIGPVRDSVRGKPLWFEAQDVEWTLKRSILPDNPVARELLEWVKADEKQAWTEADIVFACSDEDLAEMERLYGPNRARTFAVPNGYAAEEVKYFSRPVRDAVKQAVGLGSDPAVLFMGSWHGPNLEAVERIFEYAEALPSVVFLVVGSAGLKYVDARVPENVRLLGVVSDEEKAVILSAADVAINPMTSGTGSNLKMFEYMAAGIPVVSTSFGARGIDAIAGEHYLVADISDFPVAVMDALVFQSEDSREAMRAKAELLVRTRYSWREIANRALEQLA